MQIFNITFTETLGCKVTKTPIQDYEPSLQCGYNSNVMLEIFHTCLKLQIAFPTGIVQLTSVNIIIFPNNVFVMEALQLT